MNTVTPEKVGFSAARLSRIGTVMQGYIDQNKLAGLIAMVARRGKVVYLERFGMMDIETAKPMQFDTIFRIYSMSKPITSAALMMLYERGLFQLTDPVAKFLPEFEKVKVWVNEGKLADPSQAKGSNAAPPQAKGSNAAPPQSKGSNAAPPQSKGSNAALTREITIHHLLTHTAGLSYGGYKETYSPVDKLYDQADLFNADITLQEMIRRITDLPLVHQPGSAWWYSVATDVVGSLVEVISGMPLDVFLEEKIFKPLGMEDTGFYVPEEKLDRFAAVYGPSKDSGIELLDALAVEQYFPPPRLLLGGSGLVSTASDYARFCQMLLNSGALDGVCLLGRKTIELMTANHLPDALLPIRMGPDIMHGYGFGLGFRVRVNIAQAAMPGSVGECAWGGYASTVFFIDPREELIAILLPQFIPSGSYPLGEELRVLVYQALVD